MGEDAAHDSHEVFGEDAAQASHEVAGEDVKANDEAIGQVRTPHTPVTRP